MKKTGYGIYIKNRGNETKIAEPMNKYNTVYQAELRAITEGSLHIATAIKPTNRSVHIYSDSKSALQTLERGIINTQTAFETINTLNMLSKRNTVVIQWVPAHVGIEGNEEADTQAKAGKDKQIENENKYVKPHSYYENKITNYYNDKNSATVGRT